MIYIVFEVYRGHRQVTRVYRSRIDALEFAQSFKSFLQDSHSQSHVVVEEFDLE